MQSPRAISAAAPRPAQSPRLSPPVPLGLFKSRGFALSATFQADRPPPPAAPPTHRLPRWALTSVLPQPRSPPPGRSLELRDLHTSARPSTAMPSSASVSRPPPHHSEASHGPPTGRRFGTERDSTWLRATQQGGAGLAENQMPEAHGHGQTRCRPAGLAGAVVTWEGGARVRGQTGAPALTPRPALCPPGPQRPLSPPGVWDSADCSPGPFPGRTRFGGANGA